MSLPRPLSQDVFYSYFLLQFDSGRGHRFVVIAMTVFTMSANIVILKDMVLVVVADVVVVAVVVVVVVIIIIVDLINGVVPASMKDISRVVL